MTPNIGKRSAIQITAKSRIANASDQAHTQSFGAMDQRTSVTLIAALIAMLALLLIMLNPKIAISQGVALVKVDVAVVAKGYRVSQMLGVNVTNNKNEKIGTLDDIVVDNKQLMFAVLQVGGFLGLGGHLVVVPYDTLKIDDLGKKIELPNASKEELKNLSEFKYQS